MKGTILRVIAVSLIAAILCSCHAEHDQASRTIADTSSVTVAETASVHLMMDETDLIRQRKRRHRRRFRLVTETTATASPLPHTESAEPLEQP